MTLIGIGTVSASTRSTTSPLRNAAMDSSARVSMSEANWLTARLVNAGATTRRNLVWSGGSASNTTFGL